MAISKVNIDGTTHDIVAGGITYCTCSTNAATVEKIAVVVSGNFTLFNGARVIVKFTNANTASSPTLNINNTGAKSIYWHGASLSASQYWESGSVIDFVYDGIAWNIVSEGMQEITAIPDSEIIALFS